MMKGKNSNACLAEKSILVTLVVHHMHKYKYKTNNVCANI